MADGGAWLSRAISPASRELRDTEFKAALEAVLEQVLQLTDDERGELIARLPRSLEPDDGEEVIEDEWAAWSTDSITTAAGRGYACARFPSSSKRPEGG